MEHVVSDERLKRIIGRAYRAGEAGEERYTQPLADGPEVVRCRDCGHSNDGGWSCHKWRDGDYDEDVNPNGFCAWAERGA